MEPGKRADLILVDIQKPHFQPVNNLFSQLAHLAKSTDVDTVLVDGMLLMRDRQCTSLDEDEILRSARAAREDLMARVSAA